MRTIAAMALLALGQAMAVAPVQAGMMCQKKSGAVIVRNACKKHESTINIGTSTTGDVGIGTDNPAAQLDVNGPSIFRDSVTFAGGQTFPGTATLGANTFTAEQTVDGNVIVKGNVGIGTAAPTNALSAAGEVAQTFGMERNTTAASPGNALTIEAGGSTPGSADLPGGDLALAAGVGTGLGASGNVRLQTAGAGASGTGDDVLVDRHIVVAKAKQLTLSSPGFTSLLSIAVPQGGAAGGRVHFVVRATDGGSQVVTQSGTIIFLATSNTITCTTTSRTTRARRSGSSPEDGGRRPSAIVRSRAPRRRARR